MTMGEIFAVLSTAIVVCSLGAAIIDTWWERRQRQRGKYEQNY